MEDHDINNIVDYLADEQSVHNRDAAEKHFASCTHCRVEMEKVNGTLRLLDALEEEYPSEKVFENIMADISCTLPQECKTKAEPLYIKILQVVVPVLSLALIVWLVNSNLDSILDWDRLKSFWLFDILGTLGVSIGIVVLGAGFLSLSLMPVIFFEQLKEKNI
jgi:hypothetical protein